MEKPKFVHDCLYLSHIMKSLKVFYSLIVFLPFIAVAQESVPATEIVENLAKQSDGLMQPSASFYKIEPIVGDKEYLVSIPVSTLDGDTILCLKEQLKELKKVPKILGYTPEELLTKMKANGISPFYFDMVDRRAVTKDLKISSYLHYGGYDAANLMSLSGAELISLRVVPAKYSASIRFYIDRPQYCGKVYAWDIAKELAMYAPRRLK